jgi:AcrR family transcriptional regulator
MDRRRAAVEETRRRIVEATLALHSENGIFGTSWQQIADRADVSVATVYKHFPTLEELVPACGALLQTLTDPPLLERAPQIFHGIDTREERLARLVGEFFDFYERGEPYLEVDARERQMPLVQEWEAHMRMTREGFVREAVRPARLEEAMVRGMGALLDFPVFKSFRRQEVSKKEAEQLVLSVLLHWLDTATSEGRIAH